MFIPSFGYIDLFESARLKTFPCPHDQFSVCEVWLINNNKYYTVTCSLG